MLFEGERRMKKPEEYLLFFFCFTKQTRMLSNNENLNTSSSSSPFQKENEKIMIKIININLSLDIYINEMKEKEII